MRRGAEFFEVQKALVFVALNKIPNRRVEREETKSLFQGKTVIFCRWCWRISPNLFSTKPCLVGWRERGLFDLKYRGRLFCFYGRERFACFEFCVLESARVRWLFVGGFGFGAESNSIFWLDRKRLGFFLRYILMRLLVYKEKVTKNKEKVWFFFNFYFFSIFPVSQHVKPLTS